MAAPITNSNETLDSITTGLLIHEAPLLSEVCAFTCPLSSFLLDSWCILRPRTFAPSDFIVIFKAGEHCFIWEGFPSKTVSLHNLAEYKKKKESYFQPCQNNCDTFTAFCRLMDLDKQQKDGVEYLVFLGFMRKMAYLERVELYFLFDALLTIFAFFSLSNRYFKKWQYRLSNEK